jgi:hypothetical protein
VSVDGEPLPHGAATVNVVGTLLPVTPDPAWLACTV